MWLPVSQMLKSAKKLAACPADAALQGSDAGGGHIRSRVCKAGIEIPGFLEVEQAAHLLAGIIFIGSALDDRHQAGLPVLGGIAGLEAQSIDMIIGHSILLAAKILCKIA